MTRKITIFLIFVLVGLATFLTGYLFSKRSLENSTADQALIGNSLVDRFNQAPEKRITPTGLFELSQEEASFPNISTNGNEILYYMPASGEIRSVKIQDPTGSVLISKIQPNASRIKWANNKTLIADYSSSSIFYDLNSGTSHKLDPRIKNAVLMKSGDKVAYNYFDETTGTGNISIANSDFQAYKNILPTRFDGWGIGWLSDTMLTLIKPAITDIPSVSVFKLSTDGVTFENILEFKNNLEIAWSSDNQKILYSYANPSTKENGLYFMDLALKNEVALNQNIDASKCVWSIDDKTVYCATSSGFVILDTSSDQPTPQPLAQAVVGAGDAAASATDLELTSIEDYLIFKNLSDGKLYGLGLGQ
jgi:hypothetical protein